MAIQNKTVLKTYFETGDTPTEQQFIDLIDSSDIVSDGSIPFTGQETFSAGLKTDTINEATIAAGITLDSAGGIITVESSGGTQFLITNGTDVYMRVASADVYAGAVSIGLFSHINENIFEISDQSPHQLILYSATANEFFVRTERGGNFGKKIWLEGRLTHLGDIDLFDAGLKIVLDQTANSLALTNTANTAKYSCNGQDGADGTFTSQDGKTITVTGGIITSIV